MTEERIKMKTSSFSRPRTNVVWYLMRREMGLVQMNETCKLTQSVLCDRKVLKPEFAEVPAGTRMVFIMAVSPNRRRLAAAHGDHTIRIYDLASGKEVQTCVGHPRTPWCLQFHPVHDHIIASGCLAGEVRVWDLHSGTSLLWPRARDATATSLTFHPYEPVLAVACAHDVTFWNWTDMSRMMTWRFSTDHAKVRWIRFSPHGNALYTGTANRSTDDSMDQPTVSHIGEEGVHNELTPVYSYIREEWSRLQSSLAGWMTCGVGPTPSVSYVVRDSHEPSSSARGQGRGHSETGGEEAGVAVGTGTDTATNPRIRVDRPTPTIPSTASATSGVFRTQLSSVEATPDPSASPSPDTAPVASNGTSNVEQGEPMDFSYATLVVDSRSRRQPNFDIVGRAGPSGTAPRTPGTLQPPNFLFSSRRSGTPTPNNLTPPNRAHRPASPVPAGEGSEDLERHQQQLFRQMQQRQLRHHAQQRERQYLITAMLRQSVLQAAQTRVLNTRAQQQQQQQQAQEREESPDVREDMSSRANSQQQPAQQGLQQLRQTLLRELDPPSRVVRPYQRGPRPHPVIVKVDRGLAPPSAVLSAPSRKRRRNAKQARQEENQGESNSGLRPGSATAAHTALRRRHRRSRWRQHVASVRRREGAKAEPGTSRRGEANGSASTSALAPASRRASGKRALSAVRSDIPSKHARPGTAAESARVTMRTGGLPPRMSEGGGGWPIVLSSVQQGKSDPPQAASADKRRPFKRYSKLVSVDLAKDTQPTSTPLPARPSEEADQSDQISTAPPSRLMPRRPELPSGSSASVNLLRSRLMGEQHDDPAVGTSRHSRCETLLRHSGAPSTLVSRHRTLNRPRPVQVLPRGSVVGNATVNISRGPTAPLASVVSNGPLPASASAREVSDPRVSVPTGFDESAQADPMLAREAGEEPASGDARWLNLETRQVAHRDYGVPILDQTVNMPRTLRRLINQTIAGLIFGRGDGAVASNILGVNYKIRRWDMRSTSDITVQIANNCVVKQCKIHNDSSVSLSPDGSLLAAFVPTQNMPEQNVLSVYSTLPGNLGQCLFTKMLGPNAITVDFSPVGDMVLVGLASRRTVLSDGHFTIAQAYRLANAFGGEKSMELMRNVVYSPDDQPANSSTQSRSHVSINAAVWLPHPCVGFAFGTTTSEVFKVCPGVDTNEDAALQLRSVGTQTAAAAAVTASTETSVRSGNTYPDVFES